MAALVLLAGTTLSHAAATKEQAVAMVKDAVATIGSEGAEKAYAEINKGGKFHNGELYVIVQSFDGVTLAHAVNPKLLGKHMLEQQDVDGKFFVKERVELARKEPSFWTVYKFTNPATKKIEVKDMYCEGLKETVVCAGVYKH